MRTMLVAVMLVLVTAGVAGAQLKNTTGSLPGSTLTQSFGGTTTDGTTTGGTTTSVPATTPTQTTTPATVTGGTTTTGTTTMPLGAAGATTTTTPAASAVVPTAHDAAIVLCGQDFSTGGGALLVFSASVSANGPAISPGSACAQAIADLFASGFTVIDVQTFNQQVQYTLVR